jgi:hypothetical protein
MPGSVCEIEASGDREIAFEEINGNEGFAPLRLGGRTGPSREAVDTVAPDSGSIIMAGVQIRTPPEISGD